MGFDVDRVGPRAPGPGHEAERAAAPAPTLLQLQRAAGNAAVTRFVRAAVMRAGDGPTTATPPRPNPAAFLNSFTPLFRMLLAKVDRGEPLDRVDLDALRELRAEARERGFANLVADCDELIERARARGVVEAPEEAAVPQEEPAQPPDPDIGEITALAEAVGAAISQDIRKRLRESWTGADNWRGGRLYGRYGGTEFVLYEAADLLLTRRDADAIEAAMLRVAENKLPGLDVAALWTTVAQLLTDRRVPVADVLALLAIYAEPPPLPMRYSQWFREAASAHAQAGPRREPTAESDSSGTDLAARPATSHQKLALDFEQAMMRRAAAASGYDIESLKRAWQRLERELTKLRSRRAAHNLAPGAQHAGAEFDALDEQIDVLRGLQASLLTLRREHKFAELLTFKTPDIEAAIESAYRTEAKLRKVIDEQAEIAAQSASAIGGPAKVGTPTSSTPVRRAGGMDGVFDPGFTEDELANWIDSMAPKRTINPANLKQCVAYIAVHGGKGGGGTGMTHGGLPVFHISHGKRGSTDGCTIFFTVAADGTVTIVGIGSHHADYKAGYRLDWKLATWTSKKFVTKNIVDLEA
jgi:hypothetical protein